MKKNFLRATLLVCITTLTGFASELLSQDPVEGEMTFSVRTVTFNGNFSPKHVLAIWIEDNAGFVLTRKLRADKRKQYLYTWNSNAGGNVTDATTGATLASHQTHSVTWDCRDVNGDLVPDGEYTVYVEFTEEHAQGPLVTISFTKGSQSVSIAPADEANFKDMELVFEPAVVLTAAFTYSLDNLTVDFTNTSTGADSYSWDFGDGNTGSEVNPVYTYADPGTYTVVLTASAASNSASYEQSITVSTPTGVENPGPASLQIYPNPTNGIVIISLDGHAGVSSLKIFNLKGSLLYSQNLHTPGYHLIDISEYENGAYIMQIDNEYQSSYQMIIKE